MFASKSLVFTLFFAISFLFALSSAEANVNGGDRLPAHRRAALANRMVKVRQTPGLAGGDNGAVAGVGEDPNQGSSTTTSTSAAATSTTSSTTSASATTTKATSATTTSTTSTSSATSTASTTSTTASTTSTTLSSSSSSSSTTSTSSTTSASRQQTSQANVRTTVIPDENVTLTITGTSSAESQTASSADTSSASSTSSVTKTTLTVIIVIASCVGGAVLIWTVIRKWKFRPSAQFEDRMQPIDWQPTLDTNDDPIPGHRRRGSGSSNRSYNSGSDHGIQQQPAAGLVPDVPNHDFTAAGSGLAPMAGYADLARGPSPQPQMQELARGPSMNRAYPAYPQASYENYGPRY